MTNSVLDTLNKNQREAACTIDQHVRIIAGAGSGKTRVLMARIVYLVKELGIYPSRILAITFTNKATNEMKERLYALLQDDARLVRISTIHSLCVRILREDGDHLGYPKSFTILDTDDQKQILRPFYKQLDIDKKAYPMGKVLAYISSNKSNDVDPDMAEGFAMSHEQEIYCKLYRSYEMKRHEMKAMDFDDLLIEGHRLLKNFPTVRNKWQSRLDYIHVDEFQDVDATQYNIIRMLTGPSAKLCVVGDPDQTIYTWRGASVQIILRFDKDFKDCRTVMLNENYRSTQPILDASNAVIAHNQSRIEKELYTHLPGKNKLMLHQSIDDNEEPVYVARQIHDLHKDGLDYKDLAVLYRSNYSSRAFERVLRKVGIPYRIYGGIRFYERQEIKDALCYLKLCADADPDDPKQLALDLAVLRVINQPRRGIGAKTIEKLQQQAIEDGTNLMEVMRDPQQLTGATRNKCMQFVQQIDTLRSHREDYSLEDYLDYIMEEVGYYRMLEDNKEEERIENIKELKSDIAQSLQEDPEMTLETYLQDIALFTDKSQESRENAVSLMTVHAAKGLEFDTVFIVNFNEGVFPSTRSIQEGGKAALEEERRLCYVAMTRAKKRLFITWNQGYSYMLETYKTPSRFLNEIPDETIHMEKKKEQPVTTMRKPSSAKYRKGDLVIHSQFGQGVIIDVQGTVATIAFERKYGVKKLNALHPSLKKLVS